MHKVHKTRSVTANGEKYSPGEEKSGVTEKSEGGHLQMADQNNAGVSSNGPTQDVNIEPASLEGLMKAIAQVQITMERRFELLEKNILEKIQASIDEKIRVAKEEITGELNEIREKLAEVENKCQRVSDQGPCKRTVVIKKLGMQPRA